MHNIHDIAFNYCDDGIRWLGSTGLRGSVTGTHPCALFAIPSAFLFLMLFDTMKDIAHV